MRSRKRTLGLALLILVALSGRAEAQIRLTLDQLQTLKADILADATLNAQPNNSDGNTAIASLYAVTATPDFWVWRTFVADTEIYSAQAVDGSVWSWTIYINRSQAERDGWRQLVNMFGGLNPSLLNVRTGIADIFSGAGGANQRAFLTALGRRVATRVEKLLATGTGSTGSPGLMQFEGRLTSDEVQAARNLP